MACKGLVPTLYSSEKFSCELSWKQAKIYLFAEKTWTVMRLFRRVRKFFVNFSFLDPEPNVGNRQCFSAIWMFESFWNHNLNTTNKDFMFLVQTLRCEANWKSNELLLQLTYFTILVSLTFVSGLHKWRTIDSHFLSVGNEHVILLWNDRTCESSYSIFLNNMRITKPPQCNF